MSKNKLDQIKDKIRQGNGNSAAAHFLDATIIEEDRESISTPIQSKIDEYVNVDVDVPARKPPKKKFEETHTRKTFWIRNELMDDINAELSVERGAMTQLVNDLLTEYFSKRKR